MMRGERNFGTPREHYTSQKNFVNRNFLRINDLFLIFMINFLINKYIF